MTDTVSSRAVQVGKVVVATPCAGGMVTTPYLLSSLRTAEYFRRQGVPLSWLTTDRESLVQRARNILAAKFMAEKTASHLIFIDADIEWEPDAIARLLSHDKAVVCGVYPMKCVPTRYAVRFAVDENGNSVADPVTRTIQIEYAATGFLCIKREVFDLLGEAYPELKFTEDGLTEDENAYMYDYFHCSVEDGRMWGEDFGFSRLWRRIGGNIWFDPAIKLKHHGSFAYEGDVSKVFRWPDESA